VTGFKRELFGDANVAHNYFLNFLTKTTTISAIAKMR